MSIKQNHKNIILFLVALSILSCKTGEKFDYSLCKTYKVIDSKQITWSVNAFEPNLKMTYNELRFCTHHPDILAEITYEDYGKWDSIIRNPKNKNVVLLWNNVMSEELGQPITIATASYHDAQSAIMIFDKNGKDLLSDSSENRTYLIDFLTKKINAYDVPGSRSKFNDLSWKEINPESYKKYHSD